MYMKCFTILDSLSCSLIILLLYHACHEHTHTDAHTHSILLFDETRLLKLCDFGTAKVLEQSTMSGTLAGTAY